MLVKTACIGGGTMFVKGHLDDCPIILCDTFNFWKCRLADVGRDLEIPKMAMPAGGAPMADWLDYCERDVEVCAAAFDSLIGFMRAEDLGPWAATTAGLSFSAYRHRFMRHKVLVHDDAAVLKLERQAYYGGIVDVAFVGKVPVGRVYELDVRSMYPTVCRGELPYRLEGSSRRIGAAALMSLGEQYAVCADVDISTDDETYPVRSGFRTVYPHGDYRTQLADPELREALRLGRVGRVHFAAWYRRAPIFREYMDWALEKRQQFREQGLLAWSAISKMLANALYGKAGQRNIRWEQWGPDAMRAVERAHGLPEGELRRFDNHPPKLRRREGCYIMPQQGLSLKLRDYWGSTEVQVDYGESRDSCPAISAHVTSEARMLLREYQRAAGPKHWFYSDTDSLWVDDVGLARLGALGHIDNNRPGKLGIMNEYPSFIIHAPKDYEAAGRRVAKGVKPDAAWDGPDTFEQWQFPGAAALMQDASEAGVLIKKVRKQLKRGLESCHVGEDGWTSPRRMTETANGSCFIPLD
jgi:hypothetical protein